MAQDIYTGFSEGLTGGVNMALNIDQVRNQRRQQEWKRDMELMEQGFKLAHALKGKQAKATTLNQVGIIWNKRFPNVALPGMSEETVDDFTPTGNAIADAFKKANTPNSGITPEASLPIIQSLVGNYRLKHAQDEDDKKSEFEALDYFVKSLENNQRAARSKINNIGQYDTKNLLSFRTQLITQSELISEPEILDFLQSKINAIDAELGKRIPGLSKANESNNVLPQQPTAGVESRPPLSSFER